MLELRLVLCARAAVYVKNVMVMVLVSTKLEDNLKDNLF